MEQTIEKYSFMLRMQRVDLPNSLFGKACRECCKHGCSRRADTPKDTRNMLNRGDLITGTMTMTFGNSTKRIVCHHYDCEEEYQGFTN